MLRDDAQLSGGKSMHRAPEGTSSATFFLESAQQLLRRLERDPSPRAKELLAEAIRLSAQFQEWTRTRPSDVLRLTTIRELFELNRQVLDHYAGAPGSERRSGSFPPGAPDRKR
jgi:hypothetical protein